MNSNKAFTLIELIFVIVIIGLLASYAVPKFMQTKVSASSASVKSLVSSIRTAIETKHGEWIINDNLSDGYTNKGYPQKLDDATVNGYNENLFDGTSALKILKTPIKSCASASVYDCWLKTEDNDDNTSEYIYKFSNELSITLEYNGSNGTFDCADDNETCQSIID